MRMIRSIYGVVAIAMFAVVACSGTGPEEANKNTTSLSGTINGAAGKNIYFELLTPTKAERLDTAKAAEDGSFSFEFSPEHPGFYRLFLDQQNFLVLILDSGEQAQVTADLSNLAKSYKVSGSSESARLKELNEIIFPRDSLNMIMQQARMQQNQQALYAAAMQQQNIMATVNRNIKDFINREPGSLSSLAALQNLDVNNDYAYYEQVVNGLEGKADGNPFYEQLKDQVGQLKKLAVGAEAPEINLPQPSGEMLALSSLRGEYVLIDFWASWCGPCRRENPNVKRVYDKYNDKGFEIYGVSLDKDRNAWLNAIKADGLPWKHVSDLKYWNSSVVPKYQVKGIPMTVLLDPEGNIVAKNLRGQQLEEKLNEIFSE